jgi:hypothetical protein
MVCLTTILQQLHNVDIASVIHVIVELETNVPTAVMMMMVNSSLAWLSVTTVTNVWPLPPVLIQMLVTHVAVQSTLPKTVSQHVMTVINAVQAKQEPSTVQQRDSRARKRPLDTAVYVITLQDTT